MCAEKAQPDMPIFLQFATIPPAGAFGLSALVLGAIGLVISLVLLGLTRRARKQQTR